MTIGIVIGMGLMGIVWLGFRLLMWEPGQRDFVEKKKEEKFFYVRRGGDWWI